MFLSKLGIGLYIAQYYTSRVMGLLAVNCAYLRENRGDTSLTSQFYIMSTFTYIVQQTSLASSVPGWKFLQTSLQ